jgi:hypothetical protein
MGNNRITPLVVISRFGYSRAVNVLYVYCQLVESMQVEIANLMDDLITPVKLFSTVPVHQNSN